MVAMAPSTSSVVVTTDPCGSRSSTRRSRGPSGASKAPGETKTVSGSGTPSMPIAPPCSSFSNAAADSSAASAADVAASRASQQRRCPSSSTSPDLSRPRRRDSVFACFTRPFCALATCREVSSDHA